MGGGRSALGGSSDGAERRARALCCGVDAVAGSACVCRGGGCCGGRGWLGAGVGGGRRGGAHDGRRRDVVGGEPGWVRGPAARRGQLPERNRMRGCRNGHRRVGRRRSIVDGADGAGGSQGLRSVACVTPVRCVAVGPNPSAGVGPNAAAVAVETGGGLHSWKPLSLPGGSGSAAAVTCPTSSWCQLVGGGQPGAAGTVDLTSSDGGSSWSSASAPTGLGGAAALWCPPGPGVCVPAGRVGAGPAGGEPGGGAGAVVGPGGERLVGGWWEGQLRWTGTLQRWDRCGDGAGGRCDRWVLTRLRGGVRGGGLPSPWCWRC